MPFAAVLFDLDGVLVDSRPVVERVWNAFAAEHGLDPAFVAHVHGRRSVDTIAEVAPQLVHLAGALDEHEATILDGLAALAGAGDLLAALAPDRCAVVTSGGRTLATTRLPAVGLPLPAVLITAEDVAEGKPDLQGHRRRRRSASRPPTAWWWRTRSSGWPQAARPA